MNRSRLLPTASLYCAVGVLFSAALSVADEPATRIDDVIYGRKSGMALTMDVFVPEKQNGAAVVHLANGDKDEVVQLQQSEVLTAKLKEAGVTVKLVVRKDGGHPWHDFWNVDGPQLADWFDEHLKLSETGQP